MTSVAAEQFHREQDAREPIFCGECNECGWTGPPVGTIEEAMRDADAHQCPQSAANTELPR